MTTPVKAVEKKAVKKVRIPKAHNVSVAARVRYLNEQGMARADIARQLDIRYQRVRNVLVPRKAAVESEIEETSVDADESAVEQDLEQALEASLEDLAPAS